MAIIFALSSVLPSGSGEESPAGILGGVFKKNLSQIDQIFVVSDSNNEENVYLFTADWPANSNLNQAQLESEGVFINQNSFFLAPDETVDEKLGLKSYVVQPGDTPTSIAKKFGISVETVLAANDLRYGDYIIPGEVLIILPVSGLLHKVQAGDTVSKIAKTYKASFDDIIAYNLLPADGRQLKVGQLLVVPGGKTYIANAPLPAIKKLTQFDNYYVFPTTGRNWGRLHSNNAVDIANACGTPVYAAASGRVVEVALTNSRSSRANGGYGNYILIAHNNGTKTRYAHLLTALVNEGDFVSRGRVIAWMGGRPGTPGAGRSTGCHLHFEVIGAKNPFARYLNVGGRLLEKK